MDLDQSIIRHEVAETSFGFYSSDEIRQLSVKQITSKVAFDAFGNAVVGGLYDPALGPIDFNMICPTCHMTQKECPGHLGHIDLPVPVYNPLLYGSMLNLLKRKCFACHKFRMLSSKSRVIRVQILLLDMGMVEESKDLLDKIMEGDIEVDESSKQVNERQQTVLDEYERLALSSINHARAKETLVDRTIEVRRNEILAEFLKNMPKTCGNCGAISPSIRQDANTKIFLKPLGSRAVRQNKSKCLEFLSAFDLLNGSKVKPLNLATADENEPMDDSDDDSDNDTSSKKKKIDSSITESKLLVPLEVYSQMHLLWKNEGGLMELIWGDRNIASGKVHGENNGWKKFFLNVIPVAPSRFRPPTIMKDVQFEHSQNIYLGKILQLSEQLLLQDQASEANELGNKSAPSPLNINLSSKLYLWTELQDNVNCLIDNNKARRPADMPQGIRQVIEKKEGLFRKHMMGKRVNYAARSVISPDPYIGTSEIGVPLKFAKTLTYPQPVTAWNVVEMRELVKNGPDVHPGANFVENEFGRLIDLRKRTPPQREAISKTLLTRSASASGISRNKVKRVWRHLKTGDVVLMNRQPTLHKPSMMAHVTRVLKNPAMQTIRMHYANCNTFNADFDGDEMNMHFPQNELARAEAYNIALNEKQYIVPTDGSPLRGLIQDHVGSGVKLTKRDTFLSRDIYMQILFNAWSGLDHVGVQRAHFEIVPPTILKPEPLWTGKQVVTSILKQLTKDLPQLNLDSKAKVKAELFGKSNEEHLVVFRDGELLQGVLDKSQFGAAEFGFVHAVYEIYGSQVAADLLTALGRLFTSYLQFAGHTCALEDLTLNQEAEDDRSDLVHKSVILGQIAYADFADAPEIVDTLTKEQRVMNEKELNIVREKMRFILSNNNDEEKMKELDSKMMQCVHGSNSDIIKACLPGGQTKPFPENCFSLMVQTGAKGSMVNHTQISCGLGQQALEGRRVPILVSGRSLPSFEPFDPSPRAGGYITDRFLTGLRPQEYYHHCMAGREGLVDTAVKTSRSGYLQRCLVKHLEDLVVNYDHTVRNSDGNVIQFLYGEDAIDPVESAFLSGKDEQMSFLAQNHSGLSHKFSIHREFFENTGFKYLEALKMHQEIQRVKKIKTSYRESKKMKKFLKQGTIVLARRLLPGKNIWKREHLEKGWFEAEVLEVKAKKRAVTVDIVYCDTKLAAYNVPTTIFVKGRKSSDNLSTMSGTVDIIKFTIPDPVMGSLPLNKFVGVISEHIQEKIQSFCSRNPNEALFVEAKESKKINAEDITEEDGSIEVQETNDGFSSDGGKKGKKSKKKKKKKSKEQKCESKSEIKKSEENEAVEEESSNETVNTSKCSERAFELLLWMKYMRSLCQPGENVGTIAAQSIGEPSTQMTLNTFHLAGHGAANVTLGIPRLREIIMTASKTMKTPAMTIPLLDHVSREDSRIVEQQLNQIPLSQLLHNKKGVCVTSSLKKSDNGILWIREYTVRLCFQEWKTIKKVFGIRSKEIMTSVGMNFAVKFLKLLRNEMKKSGVNISTESALNQFESKNSSKKKKKDDDDEEEEDDDEQGTLRFGKQDEAMGYGEMDDEEKMIQKQNSGINDIDNLSSDDEDDNETRRTNVDLDIDSDNDSNTKDQVMKGMEQIEVHHLVTRNSHYAGCGVNKKEHYIELKMRFPAHFKTLLLVPLVEKTAAEVLVRHCPGISRCFYVKQRLGENNEEIPCIQTEGLNFQRMWELSDLLDVNRIATNDIFKVLETYGVEAARASVSKQINEVFGVYGINVDPRHLNLLADYMTAGGGYMPLNRSGMAHKGSPFQQITFETSMNFLSTAATFQQGDYMESPSARLVLGQPAKVGTGCFSLLQPVEL